MLDTLPLWGVITLLVVAGVVIAVAGTRLATVADQLADRTGMGEAIAGAVFVGAATSLPGLLTTVIAAAEGLPTLAVSNALGGIAVQTLWLVVGDAFLRRANLEHAAAAPENIFQGALLVALLSLPLLAMSAPPFTLFGFLHPVSILLPALWFFGMRMMREVRKHPMWRPLQTPDTVLDEPNEDDDGKLSARQLWISFLGLALILGGAGWALAESGGEIVERTALSESVVGALFTATLSSTPELVVVIAAVRQGAHTLAISNIIGGNAFDTLFIFAADVAFLDGSIYHAITRDQQYFLVLTILMTGVLLMGLVRRERQGPLGIGFESVFIVGSYVAAVAGLFFFAPA